MHRAFGLWPWTASSVLQVGQLARAPDSDWEMKLQHGDGSERGYIKVDRLAKASHAALCEAVAGCDPQMSYPSHPLP